MILFCCPLSPLQETQRGKRILLFRPHARARSSYNYHEPYLFLFHPLRGFLIEHDDKIQELQDYRIMI